MKNTPTWLRNLPPEWDIIQIKHLALSGRESFIDGDWIESQNISTEGIRYLTSGNVGEGKFKEQGNGFVTEDICRELNCKYAYPGDFVFRVLIVLKVDPVFFLIRLKNMFLLLTM